MLELVLYKRRPLALFQLNVNLLNNVPILPYTSNYGIDEFLLITLFMPRNLCHNSTKTCIKYAHTQEKNWTDPVHNHNNEHAAHAAACKISMHFVWG